MAADEELQALLELLADRTFVVLSGAGLSTDSGIPDYRSPGRIVRTPIQHRDFLRSEATRRRYWARSHVGWRRLSQARPNAGHEALAALEAAGLVRGIITQNVDGLHTAAGSRRVVELHGSLAEVRCLDCDGREPRAALHLRMASLNDGWGAPGDDDDDGDDADEARARPDGDAELSSDDTERFRVPGCERCGGTLKPDVVFFGDNVRAPVLEAAWRLFDEGERLLVVGSSLTVFSGYRFVRRAKDRGLPIAILTRGPTRGDGEATLKCERALGEILPRLARALVAAPSSRTKALPLGHEVP